MAKILYCWRCNRDVAMLDKREWGEIEPELSQVISKIQQYRRENKALLSDAMNQGFGEECLMKYRELTGYAESDYESLWHHRISLYGPACTSCGKPLRSPAASYCAACGAPRSQSITQ